MSGSVLFVKRLTQSDACNSKQIKLPRSAVGGFNHRVVLCCLCTSNLCTFNFGNAG